MGPAAMPEGTADAINAAITTAVADPVAAERFVTMRFPLTGLDLAAGRARLAETSERVRATAARLDLNGGSP